MKSFEQYVAEVEGVAKQILRGTDVSTDGKQLGSILNGGPGTALEQTLSIRRRRQMGAFFTGSELRSNLLSFPGLNDSLRGTWDPACGAGDLLLEASAYMDVDKQLGRTLNNWAKRLSGTDIEPMFIRIAKARLIIAAYSRGSRTKFPLNPSLIEYFPLVMHGDSLSDPLPDIPISHIFVNPPFGSVQSKSDCTWARGTVSQAAVFIEHCLTSTPVGTRIAAILPDVLRTGSRYKAWREWICLHAQIDGVRICGRFSKRADVDVCIAYMTIRPRIATPTGSPSTSWAPQPRCARPTIADRFTLSVGAVVPHRSPESGPHRSFLNARAAKHLAEIRRIPARLRFSGTVARPPFLVLHRTSSPSDKVRPVVTLILGKRPVAVENHLIVLSPKSGLEQDCRRALLILSEARTTEFLDQRIRCRHLTLDAIGEIPWPATAK